MAHCPCERMTVHHCEPYTGSSQILNEKGWVLAVVHDNKKVADQIAEAWNEKYGADPHAHPMTTGDKAELLPCPFCGGAAKMEFTAAFWIECESCHVQTSRWGTRKKAVSAWNTRASSPPSEVVEPLACKASELQEYGCACRWEGEKLADICDAHKAALSGVPEGCAFCGRPVGSDPVYDEANGETACRTCGDAEKVAQKREAILSALKSYSQADDDGVMCIVSRQAVDEAIVLLAAAPER